MYMLTLMQQQQQTLDGNHQSQTEQDYVNGVPAENHADDRSHSEAERLARETAVVTPGNGSVGDSPTHWNDVDNDNEEEETDVEEDSGWITNQPISSTIVQQQQAFTTTNGDVVLPNPDPSDFSGITVTNSTRVRVGNETIYNGPVTINQFVYTNPTSNQDAIELDVIRPSDNISDLSTSQDNGAPNESIFPQNIELNKVTQWLWTWKRAVLSCVLTSILLAIVVPITVHLTHQSDASVFPEIPTSSLEGTNVTDASLRFVERDEWGALPPLVPLIKRKLPVAYVIISHSATSVCITPSDCAFQVRFLQYSHFNDFNFVDIGYNFLVGGDGFAYVGRSWNYVGAHARGYNSKSIGISFIGGFNLTVPPKPQLRAARKIIELGVKAGKIAPDYKLLGHRQVSKTLSPGDALYNEIKKWPHWSSKP